MKMVKCLKNRSIISKIRRSKVTDYAALRNNFDLLFVLGIKNTSGLHARIQKVLSEGVQLLRGFCLLFFS